MYRLVHILFRCTMWYRHMQKKSEGTESDLLQRCVRAYISEGTLDLSLDEMSSRVGVSKRMLVHYFGSRDSLERAAIRALEGSLRHQFAPSSLPAGLTPLQLVDVLWERSTAEETRSVLLLVMDVTRRAWNGTGAAREFYAEQQRLWTELLCKTIPDRNAVEDLLQLFQGAILGYLVTNDSRVGAKTLRGFVKNWNDHHSSRKEKTRRLP